MTNKDRVRLLLSSYLDARFPQRGESQGKGTFGARYPALETYLWRQGSYAELQTALDQLRAARGPWSRKCYRELWAVHVVKDRGDERWANLGLAAITRKMEELAPNRILVPAEIKENGGFAPKE